MTISTANLNIGTDTFGVWLNKTNQLSHYMTNHIVTIDSTSGGNNSTGNGYVIGSFGANTIAVGNTLRGGNVTVSSNLNISSNATISGNLSVSIIIANGGFGTATQVLSSNGSGMYWGTVSSGGGGTVTNIATGNGLTGGPITSTGTVSVLANSGIVANGTGVHVLANSGIIANGTGVFVNSSYIASLTSNNSLYLGEVAAASYVNTSGAYTISGIHTLNANIIFNNNKVIIANGGFGTATQVLSSNGTSMYWATVSSGGGGTVTNIATGNGLTGGPITSTGTVSVLANTGIVANGTGVYVNSSYISTLTSNNALYLGGIAAASYVNTSQLSSNLALYQTSAGLTNNVATRTANNSNYFGDNLPAYYTNITGRLGYTPANKAGETFSGQVVATSFVTNTNQPYYMRSDGAVYMLWDGTNITFNQSVSTTGAMTSAGGYYTATNVQVAGAVYSDVIRDNGGGKNTGFNLEDAAISLYINNSLGGYMDSAGSWNIAGTFYSYSDRNLKNNIVPRNSNTSIVDIVEPVTYQRIERPGITEVGFIAQDVQTVFPEAVKLLDVPGHDEGILSIAPIPLIAQLWTELRETRSMLRELQAKVNILETK